ncbi:Sir2 family NAD-dependent protein deacetylase [Corynebacterium pygosceleis]|uniref:Sir2 family NAD-dependent protein deacetylase n=1 Tax=Corynebacterium pygosceleis TaxID=2800406 RepID=UPI002004873E|nr:Sir2 family NAD-dependent protein deacetylase [Corynebacterium pygosceleis]MCK7676187.1 NAD-dependent protein deacetylase [Corynebacterium pygosceleis]
MTSFTPDIARIHDSALRSISRVVRETARPTPPDEALSATAHALRRGGALVLTGAGVSTDSGIPDYRGPAGSLTRGRPMTYQEFRHDPEALHRYWARSFIGWRHMAGARPNRTHHTLVELERAGMITGIVTQNVDGLHTTAGSRTVIGLHGDLSVVTCLRCGTREPRHELDHRLDAANPGYLERALTAGTGDVRPDGDIDLTPDVATHFRLVGCTSCGSTLLKPDVVYFGEPVPTDRRDAVGRLIHDSRALIVMGSSLAVMSGYRIALDACRAGLPLIVINGGPGRADTRADVLWRTGVADASDRILDALDL